MIKVNLLPKEARKKRMALRPRGILIGGAVGFGVAVFLGVYFFKLAKLNELKQEVRNVKRELDSLRSIIEQVDRIESSKRKINQRLDVIKTLNKSRLFYPYLMEDLAKVVFPRIWVESMSTTWQETFIDLTLEVSALDNYAIADFITILEQNPLFSDIVLGGFSSRDMEGVKIRHFSLTCKYKPLIGEDGLPRKEG